MLELQDIRAMLDTETDNVLSLYLRVDNSIQENQSPKPAWRIWVKNALRDLENDLSDTPQYEAWRQILPRVTSYFETYQPATKGLAMFIGPESEQILELPVAPDQNEAGFGEPRLTPLMWLIDEYEHYLIALVDREEAHILSAYLGAASREETVTTDRFAFEFREKTLMPRPPQPIAEDGYATAGSQRDAFDDKIDDWIASFHRDVADRIRRMYENDQASRIILGGTQKAAHGVREFLHDKVAAAVVDVLPIPLAASDHEVMAKALPAALAYERKHEHQLVQSVIDMAKAGGRGALGLEAVDKASTMRQIETLIVPWPLSEPLVYENLAVDVIRSGGQVELVAGEAAALLNQNGGIAARLYYAI